MLDRATRLWARSPTIATRSPLNTRFLSRRVKRSSSACVGCSCQPSPALITDDLTPRASVSAAPAAGWRSTMRSACMASMLRAVSKSVSPLTTLLEEGEQLITSVLSRWAASSKEVRVRVLGSKKRLTTVLPRSAGTFLMSRPLTSLNDSAVSSICVISSGVRDAMPTRSLCLRLMASSASRLDDDHAVLFARFFEEHMNFCVPCRRDVLADEGGLDRELPVASVHQDRELDLGRPAEVDQPVHRRAGRPAREEHVVHQHDGQARDVEGDRRLPEHRLLLAERQVVAVERDVQLADGHLRLLDLLDPLGQPVGEVHAAGADADQREPLGPAVALEDLVRDPGQGAGHLAGVHDQPLGRFALLLHGGRPDSGHKKTFLPGLDKKVSVVGDGAWLAVPHRTDSLLTSPDER